MDTRMSPADELPRLYRSILDGLTELEGRGRHREAARLRTKATAVYSSSWNEEARRRLVGVRQRIDRLVAGEDVVRRTTPAGWAGLRRLPSPHR